MASRTDEILEQIRALEEQIAEELSERRTEIGYALQKKRVVFEDEILKRHRALKTGLTRFLRSSPFLTIITAPVIYGMIVPLAFLDLAVIIYQWICFSAWGVKRVNRSEFVVIDRHNLAYLNGIEKLNCVYCGYGNGVIAFTREVASRTEQYWCPIKHARHVKGSHGRTPEFLEFGDAEGWRERLDELRQKVR